MLYEYNLRSLLTVLFRQKWKFLLVFMAIAAFGGWYVSRLKPVYQAHGSLLVKFGQDAVPDLNRASAANNGEASQTEHDEVIESNVKILQSVDLLTKVVNKVGVYGLYPDLKSAPVNMDAATQMAIERLDHDLKIWTDSKSNVIDIEVTNSSPAMAAEFTGTLMDIFIVRQSQIYGTPQTGFVKQQVDDAKTALEQSQADFQAFEQRLGISDLDEEMTQLMQEKRDLSGLGFQSVTQSQNDLAKLQSDRSAALATYNTNSPIIQRMDANIAAAQAEVNARQHDLNSGSGDGAGLPQKLARINARIGFLEANRAKYEDYKQRVSLDEDKYKDYLQHGEDAHVDEIMNRENITRISVIDQPVVPARALPGRRKLFAIAFLLAALIGGLATVFGFEFMDDRIAYPQQLARDAGLPVLATFTKREKARS